MSEVEEIFNDILDEHVSTEVLTEANDRTIPTGSYRLDVVKKSVESASDASPWPGRLMVRIQADASFKDSDGDWKRRGRIFFDLSPTEMRDKRNRLDSPCRLWAMLAPVVGTHVTNREILEYIGMYPLTATVTRSFKKSDGSWTSPKTEEEGRALMAEGAEPRNFVQSLRQFNG